MEEGEGSSFGQSMAMPKEVVHVRIGRPTVAIPGFHRPAAFGGHPSAHQEAANIKEVHQPPSAD
jgi:hypothetical protein